MEENVLLIVPGGGDPFFNDLYYKIYQLIIEENNIKKKYESIKVLAFPGHFSYDEISYWNIDDSVLYLQKYLKDNQLSKITLLGRSGGCNIILKYLLDNLNDVPNISEIFLINPAHYNKVLDLFIDNLAENKTKALGKGLRVNNKTHQFIPIEYLLSRFNLEEIPIKTNVIIAKNDIISFGDDELQYNRINFIMNLNLDNKLHFIDSDKHEIDDFNKDEYFKIIFNT